MRPLRAVVDRVHPVGMGMWDVLECGHRLPYTGVKHEQRRCNECPEADPDQMSLL